MNVNVAGKLKDVISRRNFIATAAAATVACRSKRATGYSGYAFVANYEGQAIAAVDLTAFAVVRHIRLNANPTEVLAHPNIKSVFALTPATGTVHEIDPGRLSITRQLQAGSTAVSMRVSWQNPRNLYVLYRDPRRLAAFSLETGKVDWQLTLPGEVRDFDISNDGRSITLSFGESGQLGIVDTTTHQLATLDTGTGLGFVRFRSDGRAIHAADTRERRLLIFDSAQRRLVVRLPLAVRPDQICSHPDGGQLFITGAGLDAVVVVYPYQTQVAETVLAGHTPGAMAASSGVNPYLFIANPASGDVTIFNITTRKVSAAAVVGAEPSFIAITPDNQFALILNRKSGDMGVLRIHDRSATPKTSAGLLSKNAGLFTMIPVGSQPVSAAVRQV